MAKRPLPVVEWYYAQHPEDEGERFCRRCGCCSRDEHGCLGNCNDIGMHRCEDCGDLKLDFPRELKWARNWCASCAGNAAA
jgi:hypothetical protein